MSATLLGTSGSEQCSRHKDLIIYAATPPD